MRISKLGFTLAEVLITIAVLGVVASVTLPTIQTGSNYQQLSTKLAKFNANLENAAANYTAVNGDFLDDNGVKNFFKKSFLYKDLNQEVSLVPSYSALNDEDTVLYKLKDDTAIAMSPLNDDKFAVRFYPNIKGIGSRSYYFNITKDGYVTITDDCTTAIYENGWQVKKEFFNKTNGKCK